jgi:hypothetical protein
MVPATFGNGSFQPVSDGQDHRLLIFKIERQEWSVANLGCAAKAATQFCLSD